MVHLNFSLEVHGWKPPPLLIEGEGVGVESFSLEMGD